MILFPHVLNSKGIFDNNQKLALDIGFYITAKLQEISLRQGMDVVAVTTRSTEGKSAMDYADDFYDYNGYAFYIEADVQAIQTHNINDAISSLWGVSNVSAANGKLTVK